MDMDKIKRVEDQILADDELIVMNRDTADALVTIAESVLICEALTDDGEVLTVEVLQPSNSSWDELDRLLSAMHVIRWQHCDDNEYNMTKYGERVAKTHLNSLYGLSARAPHIGRMQYEYAELCVRLNKLLNYYDEHRSQLTAKQRDLIMDQRSIMEHYIEVLEARINYDIEYYCK